MYRVHQNTKCATEFYCRFVHFDCLPTFLKMFALNLIQLNVKLYLVIILNDSISLLVKLMYSLM